MHANFMRDRGNKARFTRHAPDTKHIFQRLFWDTLHDEDLNLEGFPLPARSESTCSFVEQSNPKHDPGASPTYLECPRPCIPCSIPNSVFFRERVPETRLFW
jgi:hypothetical protein